MSGTRSAPRQVCPLCASAAEVTEHGDFDTTHVVWIDCCGGFAADGGWAWKNASRTTPLPERPVILGKIAEIRRQKGNPLICEYGRVLDLYKERC